MTKEFRSHQVRRSKVSPTLPAAERGMKGAPNSRDEEKTTQPAKAAEKSDGEKEPATGERSKEIGGPKGLEPTRYGDWERNGICYDF